MELTIAIKALNEQAHIAGALRSALNAAAPLKGEVILADSGSVDNTTAIARGFPVRVVTLANPAERSCGTAAQLGFQHATGRYFYILDADMTLSDDFIPKAIAYLEEHPDVAGVGGMIQEENVAAHEFAIRRAELSKVSAWQPGSVPRLDCGGLYRVSAIHDVGYFADRNLHALEESDLAIRLKAKGWRLVRLDIMAVRHRGHVMNGYKLLLRRITSGYSSAVGELLAAAARRRQLSLAMRDVGQVRHALCVWVWWVCVGVCAVADAWFAVVLLLILPLAVLTARRGSLRLGTFSFVAWNVNALGLATGVMRPRLDPGATIASVELSATASADGITEGWIGRCANRGATLASCTHTMEGR